MVRGSSGSLDRNQSFISGCIDIPLFLILVIGTGRRDEDSRSHKIAVIKSLFIRFFLIRLGSKKEEIPKGVVGLS